MGEDTYEGDLTNPLSLNLYTYVGNNPLIYVDPSGHIPTPLEAAEMASHIYTAKKGKEYTISGGWQHSKGGAEAAANAVATNKNSIIFNPASVTLRAYDLSSSNYSASMTAFIVKGDALNGVEGWFSKPIDKVKYLLQQYGGGWRNLWETSVYDKIRNHSMGAVINALKEAGYK